MPGAEVVDVDGERTQFGIPPCVKLWFQRKLPPPTTFVLPDVFFHRGVVQVSLEFFTYYFLFAMGKASGRLDESHKLVVIGTARQIARCRRMLEVSLHGFGAAALKEMGLGDDEIEFLRRNQAWFSPKREGFEDVKKMGRGRHADAGRRRAPVARGNRRHPSPSLARHLGASAPAPGRRGRLAGLRRQRRSPPFQRRAPQASRQQSLRSAPG